MEYKSLYEFLVGTIILTSDGELLTGLCFTISRFIKSREVKEEQIKNSLLIFDCIKDWLERYFNGEEPNLEEIPIKLNGTEFNQKVWEILKTIPYGKIINYGKIAEKIAKEKRIQKMSA